MMIAVFLVNRIGKWIRMPFERDRDHDAIRNREVAHSLYKSIFAKQDRLPYARLGVCHCAIFGLKNTLHVWLLWLQWHGMPLRSICVDDVEIEAAVHLHLAKRTLHLNFCAIDPRKCKLQ